MSLPNYQGMYQHLIYGGHNVKTCLGKWFGFLLKFNVRYPLLHYWKEIEIGKLYFLLLFSFIFAQVIGILLFWLRILQSTI